MWEISNWYGCDLVGIVLGGLCAWNRGKLYNFRPSKSISPKRKLQNQVRVVCLVELAQASRVRIGRLGLSLRREWLAQARSWRDLCVLSAISRLGEGFWGFGWRTLSPRREWLAWASYRIAVVMFLSKPRLGEVCVLFWAKVWLAQARESRLSEITWCGHCFKLAQARWASLSEAEGLAWASVPSLSDFMRVNMFTCAFLCDLAVLSSV